MRNLSPPKRGGLQVAQGHRFAGTPRLSPSGGSPPTPARAIRNARAADLVSTPANVRRGEGDRDAVVAQGHRHQQHRMVTLPGCAWRIRRRMPVQLTSCSCRFGNPNDGRCVGLHPGGPWSDRLSWARIIATAVHSPACPWFPGFDGTPTPPTSPIRVPSCAKPGRQG